jgi:hypothetical protein
MKKYLTTIVMLYISLIFFITAIVFFVNGNLYIIDLVIVISSVVIMGLLNSTKNFLYILTISLILGFSYLIFSFVIQSSQQLQIELIVHHLMVTISLIFLWLFFNQIKKIFDENEQLHTRISKLKRFEQTPGLLYFSEFIVRANVILTGIKRRNETSYLIKIAPDVSSEVFESVSYLLTECTLQTIRADYDLVTKKEQTLIILLQNTNQTGCKIVLDRLFSLLRTKINILNLPLKWEVIKIANSLEDTLAELDRQWRINN